MVTYLEEAKAKLQNFSKHEVKHINSEYNLSTDALAKLATSRDTELLCLVPIEIIPVPSIAKRDLVEAIDSEPSWMDDIIIYPKEDKLPEDREQAQGSGTMLNTTYC